jgi:hypothetical protein
VKRDEGENFHQEFGFHTERAGFFFQGGEQRTCEQVSEGAEHLGKVGEPHRYTTLSLDNVLCLPTFCKRLL